MLKVVHDEAEPNEASSSVLDAIPRSARHPPRMMCNTKGFPRRALPVWPDMSEMARLMTPR